MKKRLLVVLEIAFMGHYFMDFVMFGHAENCEKRWEYFHGDIRSGWSLGKGHVRR